jgi:hypothetical protein
MPKMTARVGFMVVLAIAGVAGIWMEACGTTEPKPKVNLVITPASVAFQDTMGNSSPAPQMIAVATDVEATVRGLQAAITYGSGSGWLSATLSDSTAPANLTLSSNVTGLTAGTYQATVTVSASAAENSPLSIPVTFEVAPPLPARIVLTPATVSFTDTAGTSSPASQTIAVTKDGIGALTGLKATVNYASGAAGWLTASLSDTTPPATLTVSARNAGLNAATYRATLEISATVAGNGPLNVPVTFNIAIPPPPPPPPGSTVTIVLAGNLGACGGSDFSRESAKVVAAAHPDYVFVLGHNIPGPSQGHLTTLDDYMRCYDPTWGQFKGITYATLGDHEVDIDSIPPNYGSGMAPGADAYFGQSRIGPPGQNWYSFNLASWHVIALNVETPGGYTRPPQIAYHAGSDQLNWLYDDLSAHSNKCTLAVWYESMWISSTHVDPARPKDGYRIQDVRGVWTALYDNNADVVVNGWPYIYERFAPMKYANGYQNPTPSEWAADSVRGIRQFTSGLAGDGPLVADSAVTRLPTSEYRSGGNGVLKLVLGDGAYTWEFLNTKYSHIQDSGTGYCH